MPWIQNILSFMSNVGISLIDTYSGIFEIFVSEFDVPGFGETSIFDSIFTYGVSIFITVTIVKWLIGIIT